MELSQQNLDPHARIRQLENELARKEKELFQSRNIVALLGETSKGITSEVELERLVQFITDKATELSGAKFGAFFYNVEKEGGSYQLYTLSGVPKDTFSKFPHPRATAIFKPTFEGAGTVRYDDVTRADNYGKNPPYFGMPEGHLPVRSYLAVPVVSPISGKVMGGLFLAHPEPGIFTENEERIVEGIALQGAIAMGNAKLFEEKNATEKLLRDQKELYKNIFHSTFDAVLILNEEGSVIEVNDIGCEMFEMDADAMSGMDLKKLLQSYDSRFLNFKKLGQESVIKFQARAVKASGRSMDLECRARMFHFKDMPHIMLMIRDVSEQLKIEEDLRRTKKFSAIIADTSPVVLWLTNETGELNYINPLWFEWTGADFDASKGSGWFNFIHESDRENFQERFREAVQKHQTLDMDFRIRNKNGEVKWLNIKAEPNYSGDAFFGGLAGSIMDITLRKKAERTLQSQNNLIKTITDNATLAVFLLDHEGICTFMNPAAEQMTGYLFKEIQDQPLFHYFKPVGHPVLRAGKLKGLSTKLQGEAVFHHKDMSSYPVFFTASPILENEQPASYILEVRDTTEEKRILEVLREKDLRVKEQLEVQVRERTAELEKTNYELLQFTSIASHDLKEPVRKISIFGNMLRDKIKDSAGEQELRYINNIIESAKRMIGLINDLLTFSRLSHLENFAPVNLNEIIRNVLSDLELAIEEKNAEVLCDDLPEMEGVGLQIGQIFQNLLSNSLKFCDPTRKMRIEIRYQPLGEHYFKLIYTDSGIGFDHKYSEKIFNLFQRLHTRDKFEGTGIGLAIVKKIVSLHKGEVSATGAEGVGARFEIILPYKQ